MSGAPPVVVIVLRGDLEISRKAEIRGALNVPATASAAIVDLSDVKYADSTALTELLRFCHEARQGAIPAAIVINTPQLARIADLAGLHEAAIVCEDCTTALDRLRKQSER